MCLTLAPPPATRTGAGVRLDLEDHFAQAWFGMLATSRHMRWFVRASRHVRSADKLNHYAMCWFCVTMPGYQRIWSGSASARAEIRAVQEVFKTGSAAPVSRPDPTTRRLFREP